MNYFTKIVLNISVLIFMISFLPLCALDNPHFYRATNMFLEPRIEHNFFTTFDITLSAGMTDKARNKSGCIVPLLDIFGTHPMQPLGVNLPPHLNDNPYISILNNLAAIHPVHDFATFSIDGTFKIKESNLFYIQNFTKGLFLLLHLPIRNLQIKNITFTDLSSHNPDIPNKNTPEWQTFLTSFNPLLHSFDLSNKPFNETGAGDFSALLGFTHNYQETKTLDFVDGTFAVGMLAPTGKKRNENNIFSLPLGYNGHWGINFDGRLSIGMYEWITIGTALNAILFIKNKQNIRLKTAPEQSDLIMLATGEVSVKKGPVWDAGLFFKADHFMYGLSFTAAYSCAGEQKTTLTPVDPFFNKTIINSNERLKNWYMHTLHFVTEYDFAKQDSKIGPRIGFFYNYQLGGIRIFKTNIAGGSFGIDIAWDL